jgi:hypothetical protein
MSRNNKSARLIAEGKNNRRAKNGGPTGPVSTGNKGPARTEPKHGKRKAWFQLYDSHSDYMKAQKGGKKRERQEKAADERADAADDQKVA